jgi:D-alanyl-D-alanine carboxypeptidase
MRRRIKKKVLILFISIIIIIISIFMIIKYEKKIHSISYKLEKLGYSASEVEIIESLDESKQNDILNHKYNEYLTSFLNEKYFIYENLDRYLTYKENNKDLEISEIISLINVNRDYEYYTNVNKTDTDKENTMLVNKYNALDKDFKFDDLTEVSSWYAYGTQYVREEVYNKFKEMFNDAKKENLTIIINSSYRSYEYQENLWNSYANNHGDDWADSYAAREGHSEHQTGLAIDVTTYGVKEQEDFETTDEFKWLSENAYKYGFILRYPKDKENITGYSYESWHYRYVGVEVATKIHDENITFDEYYAYYLK